jgi:hypothetical protein
MAVGREPLERPTRWPEFSVIRRHGRPEGTQTDRCSGEGTLSRTTARIDEDARVSESPLPSWSKALGARRGCHGGGAMSVLSKSKWAFLLPLALVAILATGCSSNSTPATVATGSVTCTHLTGRLAFSPRLTTRGGTTLSTAIVLKATGCTTSESNVPSVTSGNVTTTISSTSNACNRVLTLRSLTVKATWTPANIRASVISFSEYSLSSSRSGAGGFTFPNPGGTAKVTGSFAGSDNGANSIAVVVFNRTITQLLAACRSSGLASIPVTSGRVTLS